MSHWCWRKLQRGRKMLVAQEQPRRTSTNFYDHLDTWHNWDCMRVQMDYIPLHNHHIISLFCGKNCRTMCLKVVVDSLVEHSKPDHVFPVVGSFHSCKNIFQQKCIQFNFHKSHSGILKLQKLMFYRHIQLYFVHFHTDSCSVSYRWTMLDMCCCCCISFLCHL